MYPHSLDLEKPVMMPNPNIEMVTYLVESEPLRRIEAKSIAHATQETFKSLTKICQEEEVSLDDLAASYRALVLVSEREGARRGVTFGLSAPTRLYVDAFSREWREVGQTVARETIFKKYHRETIGTGPSFVDVQNLFRDLKLRAATPDETLSRALVFLKDAEKRENELRLREARKSEEEPKSTAFWVAVKDPKLMYYHPRGPRFVAREGTEDRNTRESDAEDYISKQKTRNDVLPPS